MQLISFSHYQRPLTNNHTQDLLTCFFKTMQSWYNSHYEYLVGFNVMKISLSLSFFCLWLCVEKNSKDRRNLVIQMSLSTRTKPFKIFRKTLEIIEDWCLCAKINRVIATIYHFIFNLYRKPSHLSLIKKIAAMQNFIYKNKSMLKLFY